MNLKKIFSVKNGNSIGYGYSKVVCILGYNIVIPKMPYVGFRKIQNNEKTDRILCKYLSSKEPFMLIRFGNSEINPVLTYLKAKDKNNIIFSDHEIKLLKYNAGFFSANTQEVTRFAKETLEIIKNADLIPPVMRNSKENKMISLAKKAKLISWGPLGQFENSPNWLSYLKGKKVLVIHPFAKTIQNQYKKREKIYKKEVLPEFELKTIQAVQGLDTNISKTYKSWWDALEYMYKQIEKEDFDIAIIGAGAFGIFLANKVKLLGKQAIQLCGGTQILFGIKGARWDNCNIYNEYWVSPSEEETPKDLSIFNEGEPNNAYW